MKATTAKLVEHRDESNDQRACCHTGGCAAHHELNISDLSNSDVVVVVAVVLALENFESDSCCHSHKPNHKPNPVYQYLLVCLRFRNLVYLNQNRHARSLGKHSDGHSLEKVNNSINNR